MGCSVSQVERRRADGMLRDKFELVVQALAQHDPAGLAPRSGNGYAQVTREILGQLAGVDSLADFESTVYDSFWHQFGYFAGPKQRYQTVARHLYALLERPLN